ncbi:MAG: GNAT family N-acetyltransferase [Gammaproteobacteria bacterium]|nr:GNAT family N-acetyltransferase [Gammaproteobacteria bacterium]
MGDASKLGVLVSSLAHFYLAEKESSLPLWLANTLHIFEFENRLSSAEFANFVFTKNKLILGYISIKDKCHVYHLFVAEEHQGKGVARKLWEHAAAYLGSDRYTVRAAIYAVPVYKRFGFKEAEPVASKDGMIFQPMVLLLKGHKAIDA